MVCLKHQHFILGENAMDTFIQKYQPQIKGTLAGWDRILICGTIRTLCFVPGMAADATRRGGLTSTFGCVAGIERPLRGGACDSGHGR